MAVIEYWLQVENHSWDVMPNGLDRMNGEQMMRGANGLFKPLPTEALIIRRYTANWSKPDDHPINPWDLNEPDPAQTQGTIPGATIEAKVGDEITVHFRNMDMRAGASDAERTHSLHTHGVQRAALYDGTYPFSPPDPNQNGKQGDRVAPGDSFDYHYTVPHDSNAGTWPYHDHSLAHHQSVLLGAFGTIVVRAGGEQKAELPTASLRASGDTPTHFAAVPRPPAAGEYLVFFHELAGVGECVNGRQMLGNTPTFVARANSRVKFRCANLTDRDHTFHIHGHRWAKGNDWVDAEVIGSSATLTFEMLEASAENGGGAGEWLVMSHTSHVLSGSLVVTEGGMLMLPVGMMAEDQ
jgi:FtsP/CotA-like multicopper oxidase with cupredoxin domain